jgi:hypothetical protein
MCSYICIVFACYLITTAAEVHADMQTDREMGCSNSRRGTSKAVNEAPTHPPTTHPPPTHSRTESLTITLLAITHPPTCRSVTPSGAPSFLSCSKRKVYLDSTCSFRKVSSASLGMLLRNFTHHQDRTGHGRTGW